MISISFQNVNAYMEKYAQLVHSFANNVCV